MGRITVDVVDAGALSAAERQAWAAFAAASDLHSPFFAFEYGLAACAIAPGAGVAVARRSGAAVGFLPMQARGRVLLPLAAPLTDYHGLIAAPDADVDAAQVLRTLGAARFRCTGWVGRPVAGRVRRRRCMAADLSGGYDAWAGSRRSTLKDKGRRARSLARDHGEPAVDLDDADPAALDWLVQGKRRQYALTGQHDVFACGWTRDLIHRLWRERSPRFGVQIATLRVGSRIVAAEASLRSGAVRHLWFPVYDREFARYSAGALLLLEQLRAAPAQGVRQVDFGPDVEGYKVEFADPSGSAFEGSILTSGEAVEVSGEGVFSRWLMKAERRFDVIRACEPSWSRSAVASLDSLTALGRRRLAGAGAKRRTPATPIRPALAASPSAAL